jgi:hypothetical protein
MANAGRWIKDNWYVPLMVGFLAESVNHPEKVVDVAAQGVAGIWNAATAVGNAIEMGGKTHHLTYQSPRSREVEEPDI